MSTKYTPTTEDFRQAWVASRDNSRAWGEPSDPFHAEFDRGLAAHDRAVKAEARAEVAAEIKFEYANPPTSVLSDSGVAAWRVGMARAHRIARDGEGGHR